MKKKKEDNSKVLKKCNYKIGTYVKLSNDKVINLGIPLSFGKEINLGKKIDLGKSLEI